MTTPPHYGKDKPYPGSEDNLQKATAQLLRAAHPQLWPHAFHVPNGGHRPTVTVQKRGKAYRYSPAGKKLKDMGTKPGVSDWIILCPSGQWHGAAIELKAKGGTLQKTQREFLERVGNAGYFTAICWNTQAFGQAIFEFLKG